MKGLKLDQITPLEASSWESIRPVGLLELTFSFILPFMGVRRFYKQNMWDVSQAMEQTFADP